MKFLSVLPFLFTACGAMPQFFQAAEDIADDTAIKIEVSREALNKEPNLTINLDLKNENTQPTIIVNPTPSAPSAAPTPPAAK